MDTKQGASGGDVLTDNDRFWAKVQKTDSCWLWVGANNGQGYGALKVSGRNVRAHRYAYTLHKGPIPEGLCVCHTCDVRNCVNPDHLWIGTMADNNLDKEIKGRANHPKGDKHGRRKNPLAFLGVCKTPSAKVTEVQVKSMRALRAMGFKVRQIAKLHGVKLKTARGIVSPGSTCWVSAR